MWAHLKRYGLLYGIVLTGAALRLAGIDFAPSVHRARPDEELFIQQALFLFSGDLNPHWAANGWPEFYFFLTHAALRIKLLWLELGQGSPVNLGCLYVVDPEQLAVPARLVAWFFGVLTIPLTYFLARDIHRRFGDSLAHAGGVAAAAILCFNVLHVRDSHFAVSDTTVVFFMTLGLWQLTRAMAPKRRRAIYYAAAAFGVAASIKYTGLAMLGMLGLVAVARFFGGSLAGRRRGLLDCFGVLAMFALAFAVTSPHVLTESDAFWQGLTSHQVRYSEGGSGWGYEPGRTAVHGITFHGLWSVPTAIGWPIWLLTIAGILRALWRTHGGAFVVAFFAVAFYVVVLGPSTILFMRYTQPLYPALSVLAVLVPLELARAWDIDVRKFRFRAAGFTALALALTIPAWNSVQADLRMRRPDTRDLARAWLVEHLEEDQTVLSQASFIAVPTTDTDAIDACREVLPDELWQEPLPFGHARSWRPMVESGPEGWGPLVKEFLVFSSDRGRLGSATYVVQTFPQLACGRVIPYGRHTSLPDCYTEVARFSPGESECSSLYDTFDMYMQPVLWPGAVERPGPVVVVHENECGQ